MYPLGTYFSLCFSVCPVKVAVRVGVYHGGEALCDIQKTRPESGSAPLWNQFLDFDLAVCDIPRMARLCLVIYGMYGDKKKKRKEVFSGPEINFCVLNSCTWE